VVAVVCTHEVGRTMELESVAAGDEVEIVYEVMDSTTGKTPGEEVSLEMTVQYNTIGNESGREAIKALTSSKSYGLRGIVTPDGGIEVRPNMNGNGSVDYGEVVDVS